MADPPLNASHESSTIVLEDTVESGIDVPLKPTAKRPRNEPPPDYTKCFRYMNVDGLRMFVESVPVKVKRSVAIAKEWDRIEEVRKQEERKPWVSQRMDMMLNKTADVSHRKSDNITFSMKLDYHVMDGKNMTFNATYMDANERIIAMEKPAAGEAGFPFWKMVYAENVAFIVSLLEPKEFVKPSEEIYYPTVRDGTGWIDCGSVKVQVLSDESGDDVVKKTVLSVAPRSARTTKIRRLTVIRFLQWPDGRTPATMDLKRRLFGLIRRLEEVNPDEKVAIHCAAGRGRTGTFVAALRLYRQIAEMERAGYNPKCICVNPSKVVVEMRGRRHAVVQNADQLELLYHAVAYRMQMPDVDAVFDLSGTPLSQCYGACTKATRAMASLSLGDDDEAQPPQEYFASGADVDRYLREKSDEDSRAKREGGEVLPCQRCKERIATKTCVGCGVAHYCSEQCAKDDWVLGHWKVCSKKQMA